MLNGWKLVNVGTCGGFFWEENQPVGKVEYRQFTIAPSTILPKRTSENTGILTSKELVRIGDLPPGSGVTPGGPTYIGPWDTDSLLHESPFPSLNAGG